MNFRWKFKEIGDENTIYKLAESLKLPKSLATALVARGVGDEKSALKYFNPSLDDLHDPFLMKDMEKATERVLKAVEDGEQIWIHGDYDVDGTTSASMLLEFLREIGGIADYYIPDRFHEGYGFSFKSVDEALKIGSSLIITVDVGITSYEPLAYAKRKGVDCIICDHHEPGEQIPDVYAILDPVLPDCDYPFPHLAACGVVFKLVQALASIVGKPELAYTYLDYVAVASAADMAPLYGENRILVHYGLKRLNLNPRPGFKGLIECTRLRIGQITTPNIVYALAPLINAAGRMGKALRSVEMMIQKDEIAAFQIAQQLEEENRRRRVFDQQTFEESIPLAEEQVAQGVRCLVLHKPHWHAGVIGIVASRLVDRYRLPTVLLTTIDNLAKGSARSISSFDIHSAMKKAARLLTEFGGHKHAAGLSMKEENIAEFREILNGVAYKQITEDMTEPEIEIDAELKLSDLTPNFLAFLKKFAPYGYENNKPVFATKGVVSKNGVKITGNNNIRFRALQTGKNIIPFEIDAIGYNMSNRYDVATSGRPFTILYNIETSSYSGSNSPLLCLKDVKIGE